MANQASTVLEHNGSKYNLQQLITIAGGCPLVDTGNLMFHGHVGKPLEERFQVKLHGAEAPAAKEAIIFKQEGAYTVLFGQVGPRARLVSTPALKKARIEKQEPATAERVAASTASGAMADKMQQAFSHKTNNSGLSGAVVRPNQHPTPREQTLTHQVRRDARGNAVSGYSEMTHHQQQRSQQGTRSFDRGQETSQRPAGFTSTRTDRNSGHNPQYSANRGAYKKP